MTIVPLVSLAGALRVVELLLLDERDEVGDGLLHHPGALHHLRQEHLAGAEEVADDVHAVHQRALDDLDRAAAAVGDLGAQLLGVGLDVGVDALDQGVGDPLPDRQRAPLLLGASARRRPAALSSSAISSSRSAASGAG